MDSLGGSPARSGRSGGRPKSAEKMFGHIYRSPSDRAIDAFQNLRTLVGNTRGGFFGGVFGEAEAVTTSRAAIKALSTADRIEELKDFFQHECARNKLGVFTSEQGTGSSKKSGMTRLLVRLNEMGTFSPMDTDVVHELNRLTIALMKAGNRKPLIDCLTFFKEKRLRTGAQLDALDALIRLAGSDHYGVTREETGVDIIFPPKRGVSLSPDSTSAMLPEPFSESDDSSDGSMGASGTADGDVPVAIDSVGPSLIPSAPSAASRLADVPLAVSGADGEGVGTASTDLAPSVSESRSTSPGDSLGGVATSAEAVQGFGGGADGGGDGSGVPSSPFGSGRLVGLRRHRLRRFSGTVSRDQAGTVRQLMGRLREAAKDETNAGTPGSAGRAVSRFRSDRRRLRGLKVDGDRMDDVDQALKSAKKEHRMGMAARSIQLVARRRLEMILRVNEKRLSGSVEKRLEFIDRREAIFRKTAQRFAIGTDLSLDGAPLEIASMPEHDHATRVLVPLRTELQKTRLDLQEKITVREPGSAAADDKRREYGALLEKQTESNIRALETYVEKGVESKRVLEAQFLRESNHHLDALRSRYNDILDRISDLDGDVSTEESLSVFSSSLRLLEALRKDVPEEMKRILDSIQDRSYGDLVSHSLLESVQSRISDINHTLFKDIHARLIEKFLTLAHTQLNQVLEAKETVLFETFRTIDSQKSVESLSELGRALGLASRESRSASAEWISVAKEIGVSESDQTDLLDLVSGFNTRWEDTYEKKVIYEDKRTRILKANYEESEDRDAIFAKSKRPFETTDLKAVDRLKNRREELHAHRARVSSRARAHERESLMSDSVLRLVISHIEPEHHLETMVKRDEDLLRHNISVALRAQLLVRRLKPFARNVVASQKLVAGQKKLAGETLSLRLQDTPSIPLRGESVSVSHERKSGLFAGVIDGINETLNSPETKLRFGDYTHGIQTLWTNVCSDLTREFGVAWDRKSEAETAHVTLAEHAFRLFKPDAFEFKDIRFDTFLGQLDHAQRAVDTHISGLKIQFESLLGEAGEAARQDANISNPVALMAVEILHERERATMAERETAIVSGFDAKMRHDVSALIDRLPDFEREMLDLSSSEAKSLFKDTMAMFPKLIAELETVARSGHEILMPTAQRLLADIHAVEARIIGRYLEHVPKWIHTTIGDVSAVLADVELAVLNGDEDAYEAALDRVHGTLVDSFVSLVPEELYEVATPMFKEIETDITVRIDNLIRATEIYHERQKGKALTHNILFCAQYFKQRSFSALWAGQTLQRNDGQIVTVKTHMESMISGLFERAQSELGCTDEQGLLIEEAATAFNSFCEYNGLLSPYALPRVIEGEFGQYIYDILARMSLLDPNGFLRIESLPSKFEKFVGPVTENPNSIAPFLIELERTTGITVSHDQVRTLFDYLQQLKSLQKNPAHIEVALGAMGRTLDAINQLIDTRVSVISEFDFPGLRLRGDVDLAVDEPHELSTILSTQPPVVRVEKRVLPDASDMVRTLRENGLLRAAVSTGSRSASLLMQPDVDAIMAWLAMSVPSLGAGASFDASRGISFSDLNAHITRMISHSVMARESDLAQRQALQRQETARLEAAWQRALGLSASTAVVTSL